MDVFTRIIFVVYLESVHGTVVLPTSGPPEPHPIDPRRNGEWLMLINIRLVHWEWFHQPARVVYILISRSGPLGMVPPAS